MYASAPLSILTPNLVISYTVKEERLRERLQRKTRSA